MVEYRGKWWDIFYDWGDRLMLVRTKKSGRLKAVWVDRSEIY